MESGLDYFIRKYAVARKVNVNETIYADDEMYSFLATRQGAPLAKMNYFRLGSELTRTIMQIASWRFAGKTDQIKMMEFACGYGRNLRHIVNCIPAQNIFVSDIYADAVKFNIEQFGVTGRVSVHDPNDLHWNERFDFIVVPSLFSHLPESTFAGWIAALYRLLTDDGILVFSVHGDHLQGPDGSMPESGILFHHQSESATLDKSEYGSTFVTEAFVRDQIQRATGHSVYSRTKRGFWKHQDFYMVAKSRMVDVTSFRYNYGVAGHFERIERGNGRSLKLKGWAKDTNWARNDGLRVEVRLDGRKIGETKSFDPREDVAQAWADDFIDSGFEFEVPTVPLRFGRESLLAVEAVASGQRECLFALPLGDALPDGGQEFFDLIPPHVFRNRVRALAQSGGRRWAHVWRRLRGA
jgi:SAM-dependent methyltransferase